MQTIVRSSIPKYAVIGTNSAGKSTATYLACGILKQQGINVDGIFQQDRRRPFPTELMGKYLEAHYWQLANLISVESYFSLIQSGTDVILSDRSVFDLFEYAKFQWPQSIGALEQFILTYTATYTKLFYLKPIEYVDDGQRPPKDFVNAVDVLIEKDLPVNTIRIPLQRNSGVNPGEFIAQRIAYDLKLAKLGLNSINSRLIGSRGCMTHRIDSDWDIVTTVGEIEKNPLLNSIEKRKDIGKNSNPRGLLGKAPTPCYIVKSSTFDIIVHETIEEVILYDSITPYTEIFL